MKEIYGGVRWVSRSVNFHVVNIGNKRIKEEGKRKVEIASTQMAILLYFILS